MDLDTVETLEPSLKNVIDQTSLKWVFVGEYIHIDLINCCASNTGRKKEEANYDDFEKFNVLFI